MIKTNKKHIALLIVLFVNLLSHSQFLNNYSYLQGNFTGGPHDRMIWMDDGNLFMIGGSFLEGLIHVNATDTTVLTTGANVDHIGGFILIRDSSQALVRSHVWSPVPAPSNMENFGFRFCFKSPTGEIYTGGDHIGLIDFDPGPGTQLGGQGGTGNDGFLMKFSPTGDYQWVKEFITPDSILGQAYVFDGVMDDQGNIFLSGHYKRQVDFDPGPGTEIHNNPGNNPLGYILKLDSAGNFLDFWEYPKMVTIQNLAIGDGGSLVVFGYFNSDSLNLDLAGGTPVWAVRNTSGGNPFLASYDTNMDIQFGFSLQDYRTFGLRMMTDANGGIYTIAQAFDGAALANGGVMTALGGVDVVVEKWSSTGAGIWSSILGGNAYDFVGDLLVQDGKVYASFFYDDYMRTLTAFADTSLRNTDGIKDFALARLDDQSGGLFDLYAIKDNSALSGGNGLVVRNSRIDFGISISGDVDLDPGSAAYFTPVLPTLYQNAALVSWYLPEIVNIPTSVGPSMAQAGGYVAYPNPAAEAVWVRNEAGTPVGQIKLWDLAGKLISESASISPVQSISMQELPAGIYLLEVTNGQQSQRFRIVHP